MCVAHHPVQLAVRLLLVEEPEVIAAGRLQKQPELSTAPPAFGIQHEVIRFGW